jgi:hypothetical protein
VVIAREAYKEAWLQGPSVVVALSAACLVNTGSYRQRYPIVSILLTESFIKTPKTGVLHDCTAYGVWGWTVS